TYGVLSNVATERRREIGIRIALGAARSSVLALVMKQGLQLTVIGVVVGLAGALGLNRLIGSVLFGVQPTDPATLAAVTMTITLVAAGACWLPAWRASRLDPNVVLRADYVVFVHGSQAAYRSASTRLSHSPVWFQLVKFRLTIIRGNTGRTARRWRFDTLTVH